MRGPCGGARTAPSESSGASTVVATASFFINFATSWRLVRTSRSLPASRALKRSGSRAGSVTGAAALGLGVAAVAVAVAAAAPSAAPSSSSSAGRPVVARPFASAKASRDRCGAQSCLLYSETVDTAVLSA